MRTRFDAAVTGTAVAALAVTVAACSGGGSTSSAGGKPASSSGAASSLEQQYEAVVTKALPAVVQIFTQDATGSGVVYDDKGDIVTNAHVVGSASTVKVVPATGGAELTANVLGTFAAGDLAVIRVTSGAGKLAVAKFGDSGELKVGQIVLAMGNPLGLTGSVSQGIVSALGRTVTAAGSADSAPTTITEAIQTTAAINGGNSGGALVDLAGQVIGIPSAAARDPEAGAAPGIGFAIPSNTATSIANQIISTGKVTSSGRAALGVRASTVITRAGESVGVTIVSLVSGGAAEKAGLQPGDVITEIASEPIRDTTALNAVLATLKPGQQVQVQYVRPAESNASRTVTVTLGDLTS